METIFREGDRVFDYTYGWGTVECVDSSVCVKFDSCSATRVRYWGVLLRDLSFTEYKLDGFSQNREDIDPEFFGWLNPVLSRKEVFELIDEVMHFNRDIKLGGFVIIMKERLRKLARVNAEQTLKKIEDYGKKG